MNHSHLRSILLLAAMVLAGGPVTAPAEVVRYVAPTARGTGDGASAANAAGYTSSVFWNGVQASLGSDAVTVRWLDGQYNSAGLTLTDMGNPYHRLTLVGDTDKGALLNAPVDFMLQFRGVQNTIVKDLVFTGGTTSYSFQITSNGSTPSRKIVIDSVDFVDLRSIVYGALGTTWNTYDVSVRNCTFRNVGIGGSAHMMYNAYDPHHISLYNNTLTDCMGDYVRFRDNTDYGVVIGNAFLSRASEFNHSMVAVPLFNDVTPGDEWFGTHFLVQGNDFRFVSSAGDANGRWAMYFGHKGYEPVDYEGVLRNHLLSAAEGSQLVNGTVQQKKDFLLEHMHIDGDEVRVYDNVYTRVYRRGMFKSYSGYGAASQGWEGWVDVYDTWNLTAPDLSPGRKLVSWNFDATDNGGAGWIDHSYEALENAGWRLRPDAAHDVKTFVDSEETFGRATGLMWVRDWIDGQTVDADVRFEYLPQGKIEWAMGIAGEGSGFALYNGGAHEGGLQLLGVELVDSDTLRILGEPVETQNRDFAGVDFGQVRGWRWMWKSDPDGVNGKAALLFEKSDGTWEPVYLGREFDWNVVPDTFWVENVADGTPGSYVVLDRLEVTAFPDYGPGDANGDGQVDAEDARILAAHWGREGRMNRWNGDFDGDGIVGPADASILAANWGGPRVEEGSQSSVPEPAALGLLLWIVAAGTSRGVWDWRRRNGGF